MKDGRTVTVHPFEPTASALSASVPMMCGSNETESVPYTNPDDPFWKSEIADEATLRDRVTGAIRIDDAAADRLIALYRSHRPADSRGDLALIIASDNGPLRLSAHAIAERKAAQGSAPVYTYLFKWRSPVKGGRLRSMHCMEIPFVFDHVDNCTFMNGRGADRYALASKMAEAWVSLRGREIPTTLGSRTGPPSTARDGRRWCSTPSVVPSATHMERNGERWMFTAESARRIRRAPRQDRLQTRIVRTRAEWVWRRC